MARLEPILARGHGHLITSADASPWLVAADVLITDHSSIGFEYLLLDRPLIRIAMPQLIAAHERRDEYVDLIAAASTTVDTAAGVVAAVDRALVASRTTFRIHAARSAAELFHGPGQATDRAVDELYALMELEAPPAIEPPPYRRYRAR